MSVCLRAIFFAALLASSAQAAESPSVVVLRTSEMGPYKAVEAGFTAAFGQAVQSIGLAEADGKDRFEKAKAGAKLVVAIGPDAARAAAAANVKLLATLVTSPESVGVSKDAVVPMFVPPPQPLKLLKATLPAVKTVGLLYDPKASKALANECEAAAAAAGLKTVRAEVAERGAVAEAMRSTLVGKVDALWLLPDPTVISADTFKLVVQISLAAKLPVLGFTAGMAKAGALLSVEATHEEIGRRVAEAAKRVLAGRPAAVEGCAGSLFLNAKVAELVGVALPDDVKAKAANVFQ